MAQSLKQARRQADLASITNLGTSQDSFEKVEDLLEVAAGDFITRVKANMQGKDMIVTGGIENLELEIYDDGNKGFRILGSEYLAYQDLGVKGSETSTRAPNSPYAYTDKMPPSYVFKDYIERKTLSLEITKPIMETHHHSKI